MKVVTLYAGPMDGETRKVADDTTEFATAVVLDDKWYGEWAVYRTDPDDDKKFVYQKLIEPKYRGGIS